MSVLSSMCILEIRAIWNDKGSGIFFLSLLYNDQGVSCNLMNSQAFCSSGLHAHNLIDLVFFEFNFGMVMLSTITETWKNDKLK